VDVFGSVPDAFPPDRELPAMGASVSATNLISLDASLRVGIQRTLRIPDDGRTYPLPPALGRLPVRRAADHSGRVPAHWLDGAHFLVPMRAHEAAWLQFAGKPSHPRAVKVGVGTMDALTGSAWNEALTASPQNYIVCPYQPWLDGFKVAAGRVRQFIAVPLQAGLTVEHQLTGMETGGVEIACFEPRRDIDRGRLRKPRGARRELGIGAGGRVQQRIYPDPLGIETWHAAPVSVVRIHLLDANEFAAITGEEAPPSPIDAATYSRFGLPWFVVYDSARGELPATQSLSAVKSVEELSDRPTGSVSPSAESPMTLQVRPIPPRSARRTSSRRATTKKRSRDGD
jgi:hypothetical protein